MLYVYSMFKRHKLLTLGNVFTNKIYANLTMGEFKKKVEENDAALMHNLMRLTAQVPGSRAFFKRESQKLCKFMLVNDIFLNLCCMQRHTSLL